MMRIRCLLATAFILASLAAPHLARAAIVTLEDVGSGLAPNSFYNGGPTTNDSGWTSGGVQFQNMFTDFGGGFSGWEGWAYSNVQDNTTPGFGNQYAAYSEGGTSSGFGSGNSRTYALAFPGSIADTNASVLSFSTATSVNSVDITNATYAVRAFRDGQDGGFGFAAQYRDGDYLRLHITGFEAVNAAGNQTGSVAIDLANYEGPGMSDDFYIRDWTTFDLSSLGQVQSLKFSMDSNVIDMFGNSRFLNTPAYVAVDNLNFTAVPEASSSLWLLALIAWGAIALSRQRFTAPSWMERKCHNSGQRTN